MRRIIARLLFSCAVCMAALSCSPGHSFERDFTDETLRVDLSFVDWGEGRGVSIDSLFVSEGWAGRRVNLDRLPNPSGLEYVIVDSRTGDILYRDSKSISLSGNTVDNPSKTYISIPRPRRDVRLLTAAYDINDELIISSEHELTRRGIKSGARRLIPMADVVNIQTADWPDPITLTILPDGYTAGQMPEFIEEARRFADALFSHEAFGQYRDRFSIVAVELPSADSGISRPSRDELKDTAFGAQYDSYSMDRLVTLPDIMRIPRQLHGIAAGHIVILANSSIYGGSGAYNEYCIGFTGEYWSPYVQVHELGHSFANLGDEYDEGFDGLYSPDREPAEPNITTLHDFSGKWQNLIDRGEATLIEGAGYQREGVWRGSEHCLMRSVSDNSFCPVCTQALTRLIRLYTEQDNDD